MMNARNSEHTSGNADTGNCFKSVGLFIVSKYFIVNFVFLPPLRSLKGTTCIPALSGLFFGSQRYNIYLTYTRENYFLLYKSGKTQRKQQNKNCPTHPSDSFTYSTIFSYSTNSLRIRHGH